MRYHILLDDEDYVEFSVFVGTHTTNNKKNLRYLKLFPIYFAVVLMLIQILDGRSLRFMLIEGTILAFVCVFHYVTYEKHYVNALRRKTLAAAKKGPLPYDKDSTLDITDECIMDYTPRSTKRMEWSEITKIYDAGMYIYVCSGEYLAIILPKRYLNGTEAMLLNFFAQKGLPIERA